MWWADFARNINQMDDLVHLRNEMFNDTLYQVELSHVPFPDEPPIIYPDGQKWEEITHSPREVQLDGPGQARQLRKTKIMKQLEKETKMEFIETPLQGRDR